MLFVEHCYCSNKWKKLNFPQDLELKHERHEESFLRGIFHRQSTISSVDLIGQLKFENSLLIFYNIRLFDRQYFPRMFYLTSSKIENKVCRVDVLNEWCSSAERRKTHPLLIRTISKQKKKVNHATSNGTEENLFLPERLSTK